jgi:hydrogenase nickel incorporation protein HypA/HybF
MHEMGIACSVLDAARKEAAAHPGARVLKIGLRIGEWSGVDPDSLRFCFDAITRADGVDPVPPELEIELIARENHCSTCGITFAIEQFRIECPRCGAAITRPVGGNELELAFVELEDA